MFRQNSPIKPEFTKMNVIYINGGLGDHVASLVATNYIIKTYPWLKVLVWVPNYLSDFARHLLPDNAKVGDFTSMATKYDRNLTTKTTTWDEVVSPMKIHLLDYAFLKLCDENPGIEHKNYLQIDPTRINIKKFKLPEKYVVITTGYTADVREFPAIHVNNVVKYVKSKGLEIVFLGQTSVKTGTQHVINGKFSEEIDYNAGINLVDKTSLLDAAKIMHQSQAVLGVDNGLMHVAGCTDAEIIGGFTTVSPEIRMPVRNNTLGYKFSEIIPEQSLGCKFCQEKTNFLFNHDYRNCLYKDNLCTTHMTAEKFINRLKELGI